MEPLRLEVHVDAPVEHAFDTWTANTSLWWPRSHTISASEDLRITFQPTVGGRIYERAPDGTEHEWGEIVAWEPPTRLVYLWHLFFDRRDATEVEVTFTPAEAGTKVQIEHRNWERLGDVGLPRREKTREAWSVVLPLYRQAASA